MRLCRSGLILAVGVLWAGAVAEGQATQATVVPQVILPGVPDYGWNYGCGPTAAGMLIGYWQRQKEAYYPLVEYRDPQNNRVAVPLDDQLFRSRPSGALGPNQWNANHGDRQIDRFIASYGHGCDYWDFNHPAEAYLSLGVDPLLVHHRDESLADFLGTSRGMMMVNGSTWPWDMVTGLKRYTEWRGFTPANGYTIQTGIRYIPPFEQLVAEIKDGNPAILLIDLQGYWLNSSWHFVTAYGYQDLGAQGQWVAVRDTWKNARAYASLPIENKVIDGVRWWKWNTDLVSARAAVRGMITFHMERQALR